MSKLYDDIFDEVNNHFDTPHVVLKKVKTIKDIAIKAQIELLEELRIYVTRIGLKATDAIERHLYDRIQELQKQLEA